jgi:hypothetical protein
MGVYVQSKKIPMPLGLSSSTIIFAMATDITIFYRLGRQFGPMSSLVIPMPVHRIQYDNKLNIVATFKLQALIK